jgi:thiol-disulfide isomerase/thioredoxin
MNTTQTIGIIFGLLLLGGGAWYALSSAPQEDVMVKDEAMMEEKDDVMMKKDDASMMDTSDTMMKSGSYEVYAPEKLAGAETGDVVLFFRASWCPTCRALDADIKNNLQSIPADVTILDVNYDDSSALKQKYGVTYQHTLVQVDAKGNQIAKWNSSPTLAALLTQVK